MNYVIKKMIIGGVLCSVVYSIFGGMAVKQTVPIECSVEIDAKKNIANKMLLIALGVQDTVFTEVCDAVKRVLEYTEQFDVCVEFRQELLKKQEVLDLHGEYDYVLFLKDNKIEQGYEWRLYDTYKAMMQKGLRVSKDGKLARGWGYAVADSLVPILTGNKPFASCKLLYSEHEKHGEVLVCVADFDGSYPTVISRSKSAILAPRWNRDPSDPFVLFSKYTPSNIQLVSCSLNGKQSIAVNFDGLSMQPAFSIDGKEIVVSLSIDGSSQIYHYGFDKKMKKIGYTRLTYNDGNNISPTFLKNGNIVYCSDYELGRPQLYMLDRTTGVNKRLTQGGSSFSPSYNVENDTLVYSKLVGSFMQIHLYDFSTNTERQITFDRGHKQECAWSTCGNYLVYSYQEGKTQRLASHSLLTGRRKFLTSSNKMCNYPSWSVLYRPFPIIG